MLCNMSGTMEVRKRIEKSSSFLQGITKRGEEYGMDTTKGWIRTYHRWKMMHGKSNKYALFLYCLLLLIITGCATGGKRTEVSPQVTRNPVPVEHHLEGSLWQDNCAMSRLFTDQKARGVGDVVTVNIVESATATNKATTGTKRKSSITAGLDGFMGLEKKFSATDTFNPFSKIQGSMDNSFQGDGSTTRSGKLVTSITARIVEVLPNGDFRIRGTREVTVNSETQVTTLTGIIRPRDISPNNVIQSTSIADAKITYTGTGVVNDLQRPGWAMRILNWIWPF